MKNSYRIEAAKNGYSIHKRIELELTQEQKDNYEDSFAFEDYVFVKWEDVLDFLKKNPIELKDK